MDEPIRMSTREAMLLVMLIGITVGLVFGLVPLIYGRIKGKQKLGVIGFVVSIVAGAISGVLPLFVMITFVFLILRNPVAATPSSSSPNDETDTA